MNSTKISHQTIDGPNPQEPDESILQDLDHEMGECIFNLFENKWEWNENKLEQAKSQIKEIPITEWDISDTGYSICYEYGNVKQGLGVQICLNKKYPDRSYKYEGNFKHSTFNGHGIYTYSNGNTWEGNFVSGCSEGQGVFKWNNEDGRELHGDWQINKFYQGNKPNKPDFQFSVHSSHGVAYFNTHNHSVTGVGQIAYPDGTLHTGKVSSFYH